MNKVLIDSCVWIDYFKLGHDNLANSIDVLLDSNCAVLCGMVELEIIQGIRSKKEANKVKELFQVLHYVSVEREDYIEAGELLRQLREKGITIPSSDALIATLCLRRNMQLFTLDKDFKRIDKLDFYKLLG